MENTPIRVVLADHQEVFRMGLRAVLAPIPDIEFVAEAERGEEAVALVRTHRPDVLVTEMELPGLSGLQLARRLADVPVLAFSTYREAHDIRHLLENGLAGYLLKEEPALLFVEAIRGVARGGTGWLSPRLVCEEVAVSPGRSVRQVLQARGVTPREQEVLVLMAEGYSNQAIADRLSITKHTVRSHVSHLYKKLDVHTQRAAVAWAWEHGLVEPG